ncbi:hypothetical protein [Marimonas arenosa]|uniref:Uncharacterized protein n=1 Tax=Marimonas arenosa TaxID=1795305 RepID=A0AAE4B3D2_9RHOB|nr:hypothetical protein [Marimonas arenosa]MDQ2089943.1 hypothetical protein [Marimonas arenosa]
MTLDRLRFFAALLLTLLVATGRLAAQTVDEVKLDVLSALSTPLPITVIGPIMTRDVSVTPEDDGFRATLDDATLMGIFPFGDISLKLVPLDDDTYRISDLSLPLSLDFPGFAALSYTSMDLEGTWSATRRSYSDLRFAIQDLNVVPGTGDEGSLQIGTLSFDVLKEPDETDTESRFEITARDVSARGMMPDDLSVGEIQALLSANGEKPVDLYSVIRELIMVSGMRNGGSELEALGRSLLGNTYGVVALELAARDLDMADRDAPEDAYFRADTLEIGTRLTDVEPRRWGGADITMRLKSVSQADRLQDGVFSVEDAVIRVGGGELPVADMFEALQTLANAGRGRPVEVSTLLDGFAAFGRLGLSTEGQGVSVEVFDYIPATDDQPAKDDVTLFKTGFDRWALAMDLTGLNENQGKVTFGADLEGGTFTPGETFRERDLPHVNAWFPRELRLQSQTSNLNEAFLKKLFTDVYVRDLDEPVELLLPLALYASASVFEVSVGENVYETALFHLSNNGNYRFYPAKLFSVIPYEGQMHVTMRGIDKLNGYFAQVRLPEAVSVLTVLRNLARESETAAGTYQWDFARPDIERSEVVINGTTLRFPDVLDNLPILIGPLLAGAF